METYPDWSQGTMRDKVNVVIRGLDGISALHTARVHPILLPDTHGCDFTGKKYWRVWRQCWSHRGNDWTAPPVEGQRFVDFFVEISNGDVWKADGWKKPALNFTRGNINTSEGRSDLFNHYLKSNYGW